MRVTSVCAVALLVALVPVTMATVKVDCRSNPAAPVEWLGLDNLANYDIKIRTCAYNDCTGNPTAPNAYRDCPSVLPMGSHNTTWLFTSDVQSLLFVFKTAGAPAPLMYVLNGDSSHTLAITKDAIFRECDTTADCPRNSYCDNGPGKTAPYFCHGPTTAQA